MIGTATLSTVKPLTWSGTGCIAKGSEKKTNPRYMIEREEEVARPPRSREKYTFLTGVHRRKQRLRRSGWGPKPRISRGRPLGKTSVCGHPNGEKNFIRRRSAIKAKEGVPQSDPYQPKKKKKKSGQGRYKREKRLVALLGYLYTVSGHMFRKNEQKQTENVRNFLEKQLRTEMAEEVSTLIGKERSL